MNYWTLGYELRHEDGYTEFTEVFFGSKREMKALKKAFQPPEYHGKKRIAGCRWKARPVQKKGFAADRRQATTRILAQLGPVFAGTR